MMESKTAGIAVRPIETIYKGFRFRSRLEARWAVFFDAMRVKWIYEPEGFENDSGERYLPDFYLPDHDIWCEVKPNGRNRRSEIMKACSFVTRDLKIRALVFLPNIPETSKNNGIFWYQCAYYNPLYGETVLEKIPFAHDDNCEEWKDMWIPADMYVGKKTIRTIRENSLDWGSTHDYDMPYDYLPYEDRKLFWGECLTTKTLTEAYNKARQARFEHGETPA